MDGKMSLSQNAVRKENAAIAAANATANTKCAANAARIIEAGTG